MSNQTHIIQNAITTTISEIFRGDFRRICEVKKAVLHLEAIYFCHGTCYLLKRENMPIKDQLAAEIAQTAGDEKSKDTADALTALVAN